MAHKIRIERVTLIDSFVDLLEREILSGERGEGTRLPGEDELGEIFGVSRTVVREGLSRLRERGLLETINGRGTFVRQPDADYVSATLLRQLQMQRASDSFTVDHLYEARIAIESITARLAATRATPDDIALLNKRLDEMRAGRDNQAAYTKADAGFHVQLASAANNPLLSTWLEPLVKVIIDGMFVSSVREIAVENGIRGHSEILAFIEAHDADGAADAMHRHLLDSRMVFPDVVLSRDNKEN